MAVFVPDDSPKTAVTSVSLFISIVQEGSVPGHPPKSHFVKAEPVADTAVIVTGVPAQNFSVQSDPQFIPGELITLPAPVPPRDTFKSTKRLHAGTSPDSVLSRIFPAAVS